MSSDLILCWRDTDAGQDQNTRVYYNITTDEWNCAEHYGKCESCPRLQADPDIAGVGVIAAFLVTASLTALLAIIFTVLTSAQLQRKTASSRTLDDILGSFFHKYIVRRIGQVRATKIAEICYEMVMCLRDQQPVTALALLVATIKKLHVDESLLSVFHLQLLVYVVHVSSTTFLYTIISWRIKRERELQDSVVTPLEKNNGNPKSSWGRRLRARLPIATRAFLVLTLYVLLLYIDWVTTRTYDLEWNCPVLCIHNITFKDAVKARLDLEWFRAWLYILMCIFLGWCQISSVYPSWAITPFRFGMTPSSSSSTDFCALPEQQDGQEATEGGGRLCQMIREMNPPTRASATRQTSSIWRNFRRNLAAAYSSLSVATGWFFFYFIHTLQTWGGEPRSTYEEDIKDETSMGFGQIVALFLLIQPLLQLIDSISAHYRESEVKPVEVVSEEVIIRSEVLV